MPRPGELWIAGVLFTNGLESKRRPVLILWQDGLDYVVAAVTTSAPRSVTDVLLTEWAAAGLARPSVVRLLRLDSFHRSVLLRELGRIHERDAEALNRAWEKHLKLNL